MKKEGLKKKYLAPALFLTISLIILLMVNSNIYKTEKIKTVPPRDKVVNHEDKPKNKPKPIEVKVKEIKTQGLKVEEIKNEEQKPELGKDVDMTTFPEDHILNDNQPLGSIGRLYIPSQGFSVKLEDAEGLSLDQAQTLVDKQDTAVKICDDYKASVAIADHTEQGFHVIKNLKGGDKVFLKLANGVGDIEEYAVEFVDPNCINTHDNLYLSTGESIIDLGGIYMYTCNEDWRHVTIVKLSEPITLSFNR